MYPVTKLHYEFRKKLNRIDSKWSNHINVPEVDSYLNEAIQIYFENRASIAETNSSVRDDLRQLECKKVCLECVEKDDSCCVVTLPEDYYRLLSQRAVATKEGCTEEKVLRLNLVQSDDLEESLTDPYNEPSFDWEETLFDEGKEGLYIYKKDFTVKEVCINYYRKPDEVCAPSLTETKCYIDACGVEKTEDCDLELDSAYQPRKIIEIAVLLARADISDFPEFNAQLQKILQIEQLYI